MPTFEPLDPGFPVARQVDIDAGPIVMINLCTMPLQTKTRSWPLGPRTRAS